MRQRDVLGAGLEGLVAGEAAGGAEIGQSGRQVLVGLLGAEPGEDPIAVAEVVVDAHVALVVVQRLHRVGQVVAAEPVGEGRVGQQVEQRPADRVDAIGGNGVVRERITHAQPGRRVDARGRRVVDDRRRRPGERLGEDALVHQRGRHREHRSQALVDVVALEAGEEERAIALEAAAERKAIRVLVPRTLLGAVEEVAGIEGVVAEELEGRAVEVVLAGLAADQHRRAAAAAVLGLVVVRQHLELADRVDVGQDADAAGGELVVVDTVVEPVVGVLTHPLGRYGHAAAVGHLAARALGQEAAGATGDGARAEQRQLDEVAAVQRQLGHLLGVDQLAEVGVAALKLHHGALAGDGDRIGDAGERKREVDGQRRLHFENDTGRLLGLKAAHRRRDGIAANGQLRHGEAAGVVGHHLAYRAGPLVPRRHDRAGEGCLRCIEHRAGDRAHRLSQRHRRQGHQRRDERRHAQPGLCHLRTSINSAVTPAAATPPRFLITFSRTT
jgi:hypothetical protein